MPRRLLVGFILVALATTGLVVYLKSDKANGVCQTNPALELRMVSGNGHSVQAEVVSNEADKIQGLSDRNCLDQDAGMLFTYDLTGDYCFWMKDMHFAIDMLWLDDEKRIVTVKADVSPDSYPQSFCPDRPAQYILEIGAGKARQYGWQPGTQLAF